MARRWMCSLQESRSRRADLLVLGATGESLLPHGTGTLATKCLRKASAKVMLVHASQVRPYRRVLACVDFSETSRVAVAQALHVADQDQAEVHLLHVFRAEWQIWNFHQPLPALSDFEKNYRAIMENNLRQFVAVPPRITSATPSRRPKPMAPALPITRAGSGLTSWCWVRKVAPT